MFRIIFLHLMNSETILQEIRKMKKPIDFVDYIDNLLIESYQNKDYIIPILSEMYEAFGEPYLFVPILLTFMLDLDRKKVYHFVINHESIHEHLFLELVNSKHFMHRLSLAEVLMLKERKKEDMQFIMQLLDDKIEIVAKAAIECVDKSFDQESISLYIDKFANSTSFQLESACVRLLKFLDCSELKCQYARQFVESNNWAVRYNLIDEIQFLEIPENALNDILLTLTSDSVEEVQIKFVGSFKFYKCSELQNFHISKMLSASSDRVKLAILKYLKTACNRENVIDDRIQAHLYKMLDDNNIELKTKACEILCACPYLTSISTDCGSNICDSQNMEVDAIKGKSKTCSKIFACFDELVINGNWRVRITVLQIIENINADLTFFLENLKKLLFRFMSDKVEEVRVRAKNIFLSLNKKFSNKLYEVCFDDIKLLVLSKKYHVRLIAGDIIKKVDLQDEKIMAKYRELYDFLIDDNVSLVQDFMCSQM